MGIKPLSHELLEQSLLPLAPITFAYISQCKVYPFHFHESPMSLLFPHCSKVQVQYLFWDSRPTQRWAPMKIKKQVTYFQNTVVGQTQGKHSYFESEKQEYSKEAPVERKDWNTAGQILKAPCPALGTHFGRMWAPKDWAVPTQGLSGCSPHVILSG